MIDYSKFEKSLRHLQLQFDNYRSLDPGWPELIHEAVAESVIQRFETCYDSLWKVLKRHLTEALGLPDLPNSPKPILRIAHENDLLPTPIASWLIYADVRVATAHDYSGVKVQQALQQMAAFIADAVALYTILSGNDWKP